MAVLDQMRFDGRSEVKTTEIIEKYMGGFHSNEGVPAGDSWNAQFGKYLQANAGLLRVTHVASSQHVEMHGRPTTTSIWLLGG